MATSDPQSGRKMPTSEGIAAEGEQMTSHCLEDGKGRVKINCCVTATPFPLGLSTVPPGSSAGLGSGLSACSLGADGVFFVCMFFIMARAFVSPSKKIFFGGEWGCWNLFLFPSSFCCYAVLS